MREGHHGHPHPRYALHALTIAFNCDELLAPYSMNRRWLSPALASLVFVHTLTESAWEAPNVPMSEDTAKDGAPKLTRAPKLVTFVEAEYPESEKKRGRAAAVVLKVAISASGAVDQATVVESAGPEFDASAVKAVMKFVFEPAEIDGKPSPIRILYRYEFVLRVEEPTTAVFTGTIRDRKTKGPLSGVVIALDTQEKSVTGADGRFHFDSVPAGKHTVSISGDRLQALQTEELLEVGKQLDATYDVEPRAENAAPEDTDDVEILIVAPPLQKQTVSTQVSADQGRKLPGTRGRRAQGRGEHARCRPFDGRVGSTGGVGSGAGRYPRLCRGGADPGPLSQWGYSLGHPFRHGAVGRASARWLRRPLWTGARWPFDRAASAYRERQNPRECQRRHSRQFSRAAGSADRTLGGFDSHQARLSRHRAQTGDLA